MNRCFTLVALLALPVLAARPMRDGTPEVLTPVALEEAPRIPTAVFIADIGTGIWSSSLVSTPGLEVTVGLGRHVTRHVLLTGEVDVTVMPDPSRSSALVALMSLTAHLGWDVLEIFRVAGATVPFELGPDVGVGVALAVPPGNIVAVPAVQLGLFGRYVFSESLSLGLRLRSQLPFWTQAPSSFTGGRYGLPGALEPFGLSATLSLVTTF